MKRLTILLPVALLAACSDPEPDAAPETNAAIERTVPPATPSPSPLAQPSPTTEPTADANAADIALPPSEEVGADEQMLDDASATGMTARAEREQAEATGEAPANAQERDAQDQ